MRLPIQTDTVKGECGECDKKNTGTQTPFQCQDDVFLYLYMFQLAMSTNDAIENVNITTKDVIMENRKRTEKLAKYSEILARLRTTGSTKCSEQR